MKTFNALAVVCLIANVLASPLELSEEQKAKVKSYFQECLKQENLSEEDANRLSKKDFANASSSMKCFAACFFEKLEVLKDNKVQEDVASQKLIPLLGEENTKEVIQKCKDVKGANTCDTGHKLYECLESYKAQFLA